jgi:hypothetical protein
MSPTDYIMRLIEQFFLALAGILFKKNRQQYTEALSEIVTVYQNLLGLDARQVHSFSFEELIEWLKIGGRFDAEKCLILAMLLKEEAEIHELTGRPMDEGLHAEYAKAFFLYREALLNDASLGSKTTTDDMRMLAKKLDTARLTTPQRFTLFRYHEGAGEFGLAEDRLFELVKSGYPDIHDQGRAFYQRLLNKSDEELEAGNLPRKEVEEGLSLIRQQGTGL